MELLLFQIMNALIYSSIIMSTSLNQILPNILSLSFDPTLNLKIFPKNILRWFTVSQNQQRTLILNFPIHVPQEHTPNSLSLCVPLGLQFSLQQQTPLCQSPKRFSEAFWICPICQSTVRVYATQQAHVFIIVISW